MTSLEYAKAISKAQGENSPVPPEFMTIGELVEILGELAELRQADRMDDLADARREARFGVGL